MTQWLRLYIYVSIAYNKKKALIKWDIRSDQMVDDVLQERQSVAHTHTISLITKTKQMTGNGMSAHRISSII